MEFSHKAAAVAGAFSPAPAVDKLQVAGLEAEQVLLPVAPLQVEVLIMPAPLLVAFIPVVAVVAGALLGVAAVPVVKL